MISQVNSVTLAYTPLSQAAKVVSVPEVKILPPQSARHLSDLSSIPNNSSLSQLPSGETDSEDANSADSDNETVQKNAQVQQVINQLKVRDSEVKAHEMAHLSAAGGYSTGGMSFTYQTGPDGRQYAVGGEVGIDVSAVPGDPQATLQKAMVVYRAALAPAEPSRQDYKVASAATQMMSQARADIMKQSQEERKLESEEKAENDSVSAIDSETHLVEAESILERPFNAATRSEATLPAGQSIQNVTTTYPIENSDRNQFDLRMQFSANNLLSAIR